MYSQVNSLNTLKIIYVFSSTPTEYTGISSTPTKYTREQFAPAKYTSAYYITNFSSSDSASSRSLQISAYANCLNLRFLSY